jgi:hypothetical protein
MSNPQKYTTHPIHPLLPNSFLPTNILSRTPMTETFLEKLQKDVLCSGIFRHYLSKYYNEYEKLNENYKRYIQSHLSNGKFGDEEEIKRILNTPPDKLSKDLEKIYNR